MSGDATDSLRAALKNQYHAAFATLHQAVDLCPATLWEDDAYTNQFWQVAYHALYFAHLYLQPHLDDFVPWAEHQAAQHEDGIAGPADPDSELRLIPAAYSREQVLAYSEWCRARVDGWVDALDLASPQSGFHWYPMSKLEHQLVNLRHLQHHAAQLADRLRNEEGLGVRWMSTRPAENRT